MSFDAHVQEVLRSVESPAAAAQSRVVASWRRSLLHHGLDPAARREPILLSNYRLSEHKIRAAKLLALASPKLDHLFSLMHGSDCSVVLSDADGVIIDQRYKQDNEAEFQDLGLWVGTDWSEASEGTNGIGTCIAEQRALVIHRTQHFFARNIVMSCTGAPIFAPDGSLAGVLDITSPRADQKGMLNRIFVTMAVQIANQIEAALLRDACTDARLVVVGDVGAENAALLAVDRDDLVVGANREARRIFGIAIGEPMLPIPSSDLLGLTGPETGFQNAERRAVVRALARSGGNMSAAARALGVSRATLYRHIKRLGIQNDDPKTMISD
jgi:transcriptional regulator of acetoin/glycerol metabolism